ncbi:MAG: amidohydrolase family protein [Candidatus Thorarchaeota archaeon]|nr:amidohydrolase family protein [Candidatus Thorarchaeota archaeon]
MSEVSFDNLTEHVDMLISRMDTFGIDKAVLTPHEPVISTNLYLQATEIYPDRLFSACSIVPRPIDLAKEKLRDFIDKGCVSLVLDENTYHPRDPAAETLVFEAVRKDLPVYIHSDIMTSETITFLDRISILHGEGKFVILNMGGLFGFPQIIPLISRPNIWLELSTTFFKLVESPLRVFLDAVVQDFGVRKLVFGSGYHSQYPDIMAALNMIDLDIETSRLIMKENAWLILGLAFA